ncbi:MAG: LacI family transcriptional regulator, partial [Lentisphaerae bacterium]
MTSIKDIAKAAGVSVTTAWETLNGKQKERWPSVAQRNERIRRIAHEMGYLPNAAASAVNRGRFSRIAILHGDQQFQSVLHPALFLPMSELVARYGFQFMHTFLRSEDKAALERGRLPESLQKRFYDGVVVNIQTDVPEHLHRLLEHYRIPAVWLNVDLPYNAIYPDDFQGAAELTRRLIAGGYSRIWYVTYIPTTTPLHYSRIQRLEGYRNAMEKAGLNPVVVECRQNLEQSVAHIEHALSSSPAPDAILTYSTFEIDAFYLALKPEHHLLPRDVKAATFDAAVDPRRPWMIASIPFADVAQITVAKLMAQIDGTLGEFPSIAVPYKLLI